MARGKVISRRQSLELTPSLPFPAPLAHFLLVYFLALRSLHVLQSGRRGRGQAPGSRGRGDGACGGLCGVDSGSRAARDAFASVPVPTVRRPVDTARERVWSRLRVVWCVCAAEFGQKRWYAMRTMYEERGNR